MPCDYEDNFGFYPTDDDPEESAFFMDMKCQSIAKVCVRCNQKVRLLPQIILCATCSEALEYGAPSDPAWVVSNHFFYVAPNMKAIFSDMAPVHNIHVLMSQEIAMKKQSLLNDIHFLTNQENDIREQIRELAIQALALQQEIKAHEQELEVLNKRTPVSTGE